VPSMLDAGFTTLGVVFQMIGVLVNGVLGCKINGWRTRRIRR